MSGDVQIPFCPKCNAELDGPMPPVDTVCVCQYCRAELVVTNVRTYRRTDRRVTADRSDQSDVEF